MEQLSDRGINSHGWSQLCRGSDSHASSIHYYPSAGISMAVAHTSSALAMGNRFRHQSSIRDFPCHNTKTPCPYATQQAAAKHHSGNNLRHNQIPCSISHLEPNSQVNPTRNQDSPGYICPRFRHHIPQLLKSSDRSYSSLLSLPPVLQPELLKLTPDKFGTSIVRSGERDR